MKWTKTFDDNVVETITFRDEVGTTGQATVTITQIDKTAPQALTILYIPPTPTTGKVVATLFIDEPVVPIDGRIGGTGQLFTRVFTGNFSDEVQFADLAGHGGMTGVVIDWIAEIT
jgi:hypothetical protein